MKFAKPKAARGFTLIELLVAIAVSVILLSILAFVFKISTAATRDANSRVALTERMRSLNIRLRQEFGSMLPIPRLDSGGAPYTDKRTYEVSSDGSTIVFATATVEDGKSVNVDVKYQFIPDPGGNPEKNMLVRFRDATGPYDRKTGQANPKYLLGDNNNNSWETQTRADIMLTNVRKCEFDFVDYPPGMPDKSGKLVTVFASDLNPRLLPSGVRLNIEFGADVGNPDMTERAVIEFPVYRGL